MEAAGQDEHVKGEEEAAVVQAGGGEGLEKALAVWLGWIWEPRWEGVLARYGGEGAKREDICDCARTGVAWRAG